MVRVPGRERSREAAVVLAPMTLAVSFATAAGFSGASPAASKVPPSPFPSRHHPPGNQENRGRAFVCKRA